MIVEVRSAFKDNVNSIPWMDNVTKTAVMDKVMMKACASKSLLVNPVRSGWVDKIRGSLAAALFAECKTKNVQTFMNEEDVLMLII